MNGKKLVFNFRGYSGWDLFLHLLPKKVQIRRMAKGLCRQADPENTPVIINSPWGSWRVIDKKGHVERCSAEVVQGTSGWL